MEGKRPSSALTIDRAAFLLLRVKRAFKKKRQQRKEKHKTGSGRGELVARGQGASRGERSSSTSSSTWEAQHAAGSAGPSRPGNKLRHVSKDPLPLLLFPDVQGQGAT
ncbi:unnamed protein product [Leptidea sinapis]|uniref:Uncharacterized protein n=1 Tax=Leptidea sinapis TaxID=189913 RepID=A0A5E4R4Z7_9NEOP|nr:unnamed protein product [Leptidea sinapis]